MTLVQTEPKKIYLWNNELKAVYLGDTKVRPTGPDKDYLCFTANTANSTVQLTKTGSPTSVTLETSTNGNTWNTYTMGDIITLTNIGDKVYWRNTSTTTTGFSTGGSDYYTFVMSGSVAGSGDINSLLNKNSTTTLSDYCYRNLFRGCTQLTTPPELVATTLGRSCYYFMFRGCANLTLLPKLPAVTLPGYCYVQMFDGCSKIKLSSTQTGVYQTAYRIPDEGSGTAESSSLSGMFSNTGGTFTGTPTINKTYYTSNTVV